MSTLTYPMVPLNTSMGLGKWPFPVSAITPFVGHQLSNFLHAVAKEPAADALVSKWPFNGGTISPARGGSANGPRGPAYYWGN